MPTVQKVCPRHGLTTFSGSARLRCRKCNVDAVTRRRKKMAALAVAYKGGECQRCGYARCSAALEFHHRDPEQKDFNVAGKAQTWAWDRIKAELDKCDLLCANCHREIHWGLG